MRIILRRQWLVIAASAALAVVLVLFSIAAFALRGDALTSRVTDALASALNCDVTMDKLTVQLFPRIHISGANLAIRLRNRADLPTFISIERFDVAVGLLSIVRRHVEEIHLDGLHLNIPRHVMDATGMGDDSPAAEKSAPGNLFRVDRIVTHDAIVNFVARTAQGRPLMFELHELTLRNPSVDSPMGFVANLTNPIPEGLVDAEGTLGPWNREDPTLSALKGNFTLKDADLGTINGIGGTCTSTGSFDGTLTEIHASGTSDTPDFSLDLGGKPVPLTTQFQVTVDGTDGTTRLDRVEGHLADTVIITTGLIANLPGPKNHAVTLHAEITNGRIEDLVRLTIDSPQPIMTGDVTVSADVALPPGPGRARDRFKASGTMGLEGGHFTDDQMDAKVRELSRRARGKDDDEALGRVATDFKGTFALDHGVLKLVKTNFHVPGASIVLSGTYTLGSEELDFEGEARLDASLSKAVGGFKSIFLKPFNGLFRKNGAGAVVPIKIGGTRSAPEFGVRVGAVFKGGKQ